MVMPRAADVMSSPVKTVKLGAKLQEVAERLTNEGVTGLLVIDDAGDPVGVVSQADVISCMASLGRGKLGGGSFYLNPDDAPAVEPVDGDGLRDIEVDVVMTPDVISVAAETTLPEVARLMADRRIHRVLVERGGAIVGIVTTLDVLRAIGTPRKTARL